MKKIFTKYIAVLFFISLSYQTTRGQIIYTDITDTTITKTSSQSGTSSFRFDVNNDGIDDFNFAVRATITTASGCPGINPPSKTGLSAWAAPMPPFSNFIADTAGFAASLDSTNTIGTSLSWSSAQQSYLYDLSYTFPSCSWDSTQEGVWQLDDTSFIGLKFKIGASIHYGWVRASLHYGYNISGEMEVSITIFDFAYNNVPDEPLIAGQMPIIPGVFNPSLRELISVYPNPAGEYLMVDNSSSNEFIFTISSSRGDVVVSKNISSSERINLSTLKAGAYLYSITNGKSVLKNGTFIKK